MTEMIIELGYCGAQPRNIYFCAKSVADHMPAIHTAGETKKKKIRPACTLAAAKVLLKVYWSLYF